MQAVFGAGVLAVLICATPTYARLVTIAVNGVKPAPSKPGAAPYEIVSGIFRGELNPRARENRIITDIGKAPRNARGRVEYSATFALARPVDSANASGVLYYTVPNRGGLVSVGADANGHIQVMSGWQGDIAPGEGKQTATVPVAAGVKGPVLVRFTDIASNATSVPITGGFAVPTARPAPVSLDTSRASLARATRQGGELVVAPNAWAFADCGKIPFPGTPDPAKLCLKDGFDPEVAYTLVYQGKDPPVLGIGFAATRDLVSFLRGGKPDDAGTPNPARTATRWTVATGMSQSGNFLRSFVHQGFNADEGGTRVFDGILPLIAARHVPLNVRFGVPGGASFLYQPGSEGALWWGPYSDTARKRGTTGLLQRCTASNTCPKVVEALGSAEIWNLRASPGFVGTDAKADLQIPANVRRYYFPSVTHGGGRGGGFQPEREGFAPGCVMPGNPNPIADTYRVLERTLIAWVKDGTEPPPSRIPTLAAGDLVAPTAAAMGWPTIPGAPKPDGHLNPLLDYDFGRVFAYNDVRGVIDRQPPTIRRALPSLVPRVDIDGNETAGIPSVQLQVPIGTYTGWNEQVKGFGAGGFCGLSGGFIPFARTKAERDAKGDPRLSLEERYRDHAGFVAKVREAVARQKAEGWLLADDAARIVADSESSNVLK